MNIIIVSDYGFVKGGAEKVAICSALSLSERGHNVFFFCGMGPVTPSLEGAGVDVKCIGCEEYMQRSGRVKAALDGIYDRNTRRTFVNEYGMLDQKNTVVHIHSYLHCLSASVLDAAGKCGFRIVMTMHEYSLICGNMGLYNYRKKKQCGLTPCSGYCYLSNCDKRSYAQKMYRNIRMAVYRHFCRLNCDEVLFVSDASERLLRKSAAFERLGLRGVIVPDPLDIKNGGSPDHAASDDYLYLGRVVPEKGIDIFCRAISEMNLHGVVVGSGELLDDYRSKYPNISFVGQVGPDAVSKWYQRARVMVFPSVWSETLGLTVPEAMVSAGLPCIVSDGSAASMFIKNGENGILFKTGSVQSLKRALEKIQDDEVVRKLQMGIDVDAIARNLNPDDFIDRTLEVYKEVIDVE